MEKINQIFHRGKAVKAELKISSDFEKPTARLLFDSERWTDFNRKAVQRIQFEFSLIFAAKKVLEFCKFRIKNFATAAILMLGQQIANL